MKIKGSIINKTTSAPIEGARIELTVSGKQIAVLSSDRNGRIEKGLEADLWGQTLSWTMEQEGYLNQQGSLQVDQEEISLEVALDPKVVGGGKPVQRHWWQQQQAWYIVIAAGILLAAVIVVVSDKVEEPKVEEHKVEVPNVKGSLAKKAVKTLIKAGFVNVEIKERYSRETAPGHILYTKPKAGSVEALSVEIRLVVATDVKSNKTLCVEWCRDARNSCQCKHERHGCDDGFKITKRFSEGSHDDWYACGR